MNTRQYNGNREYVENFQTYLFRDDYELPIDCILSVYHGTHADDDAGEICVEECKISEDNGPFKKGTILDLTHEEQETIQERYFITQ